MTQSTQLWGARFRSAPSPAMKRLSRSPDSYFRLVPQDLTSSIAHARELARAGILSDGEGETIIATLTAIGADVASGIAVPAPQDEDVHTFLERLLVERLGALGGKLRAGRSRNDQAANDLKLYLREKSRHIVADLLR